MALRSQEQPCRTALASDVKAEFHRECFFTGRKGFVLCLCILCPLPFALSLPSPELLFLHVTQTQVLKGTAVFSFEETQMRVKTNM